MRVSNKIKTLLTCSLHLMTGVIYFVIASHLLIAYITMGRARILLIADKWNEYIVEIPLFFIASIYYVYLYAKTILEYRKKGGKV